MHLHILLLRRQATSALANAVQMNVNPVNHSLTGGHTLQLN